MATTKRVTIQQVAQAAGVSAGTVSRILNGRDGEISISAATREHVLKTVEALHYRPNSLASALRSERTNILGALMRDIAAPFSGSLARTLQHLAHERGMELLVGSVEQDRRMVGRQLSVISSDWFDGAFLVGNMANHAEIVAEWRRFRKPLVAVSSNVRDEVPSVNLDEALGIQLGLTHLLELGHRRIGYLGTAAQTAGVERGMLFHAEARRRGLALSPSHQRDSDKSRAAARMVALEVLELPTRPTAILCSTDIHAIGVMQAAVVLGLRVPEDLSVIGYDDIAEAADSVPPLTTIHQPATQMAERAFDLLVRLVAAQDTSTSEQGVLVQPTLAVRASTAPPAGGDT